MSWAAKSRGIALACGLALVTALPAAAQSDLPKTVQADIIYQQITKAISSKDVNGALSAIRRYRALGVTMAPKLLFVEARLAMIVGDPVLAESSMTQYLKSVTSTDPNYKEAIDLFDAIHAAADAKRKVSATKILVKISDIKAVLSLPAPAEAGDHEEFWANVALRASIIACDATCNKYDSLPIMAAFTSVPPVPPSDANYITLAMTGHILWKIGKVDQSRLYLEQAEHNLPSRSTETVMPLAAIYGDNGDKENFLRLRATIDDAQYNDDFELPYWDIVAGSRDSADTYINKEDLDDLNRNRLVAALKIYKLRTGKPWSVSYYLQSSSFQGSPDEKLLKRSTKQLDRLEDEVFLAVTKDASSVLHIDKSKVYTPGLDGLIANICLSRGYRDALVTALSISQGEYYIDSEYFYIVALMASAKKANANWWMERYLSQ